MRPPCLISLLSPSSNPAARSAVLLLAIMLLVSVPSPAAAASLEISSTAKAAFDKITSASSSVAAARLNGLFRDYVAMNVQLEEKTRYANELHLRSSQGAALIRKAVTSIDSDRVSRQEAAVKRARSVYEPLYTAYTAVTQQASAASKYGNKEMAKLLRLQADTMKAGVQLARQQIRIQEEQLKAVRADRSRKIDAVRKTLGGLDAVSLSIRSRQQAIRIPESAVADALKDFSTFARKGEAVGVEQSLNSMLAYSKQLMNHVQALVELELSSSRVVEQAKNQLSGYGVPVSY